MLRELLDTINKTNSNRINPYAQTIDGVQMNGLKLQRRIEYQGAVCSGIADPLSLAKYYKEIDNLNNRIARGNIRLSDANKQAYNARVSTLGSGYSMYGYL